MCVELVDYSPEAGIFTWRKRDRKYFQSDRICKTWNARYAGKPALTAPSRGHVVGSVFCCTYLAHRVAYLWMTGGWPKDQIDHINGIKDDNRWCNLREVTARGNMRNLPMPRRGTATGRVGVYFIGKGRERFVARIRDGVTTRHLGYFASFDDACAAREAAERRLGYHPNHGRRRAA